MPLSERKNIVTAKPCLCLIGIFLLLFGGTCCAQADYTALINENFEINCVDRGDVESNITLSENYDGYADRNKKGYMVSKQMTSFVYESKSADRYGYNYDDRISSGYNQTYGNLGGALLLYPDTESADWWICMNLGYGEMPAAELAKKTLDINFSFADSGDAGRTAKISLCAAVNGKEKEFPAGVKSIKRGTQLLNSYHKRINLGSVMKSVPDDAELDNIRIKLSAPKGKSESAVKLDDIHIREVGAAELMGWDFEAEDCFTKDFDKNYAMLSTAENEENGGRALKITALKDGKDARVRFPIPNVTADSALKISLRAKSPDSGKIKIFVSGIGRAGSWKIGTAGGTNAFGEFMKEINLSEFYGVADNLENAALEIVYDGNAGDACYIDDLSVTETEKTSHTVYGGININENFEHGYIDRGDVHGNILLSEAYDGFADSSGCGYMVYKQVPSGDYNKNESDRVSYDSDSREYSFESEQWGKLGSAVYLFPKKDEWWIETALGYAPMSGRDFCAKALDFNITFADSGSSGRKASAVLCFKVNGLQTEYCMDEKDIKTGKPFLNTYHRRISLSELSDGISESDIISDISFRLTAPRGTNSSVVKFDDIHIRETDPTEINGWDFEAEDLYTSDFSITTEHLASVKKDDGSGRMLRIKAVNAEYLKQTRFDISAADESTILDISFKIKLPTTNEVQNGAYIQLRYLDRLGDLNIGKIQNSDEFIEFRKTISLADIKDLRSDFSRAALEIKFDGAVGDVCYIDDLSIKRQIAEDSPWAEVQGGAYEYFPADSIFIHFNSDMDFESVKHAGNVRINDSAASINKIEMLSRNDMLITLNEKMQEDCRYVIEFRNLKSAAGNLLEYGRFNLLIKGDKSNSVIAAQYVPSFENGTQEVTLPFVVNCDDRDRSFKLVAAAYDINGQMIACGMEEISVETGGYVKNVKAAADLSEAGENAQSIKMFLWEDSMRPQKNIGTVYLGMQERKAEIAGQAAADYALSPDMKNNEDIQN